MPASGSVGAREFKTRLGSYLQRIRQGRTLVITDRGEPVAEVRPFDRIPTSMGARLARLRAEGRVSRRTSGRLHGFSPIRSSGGTASAAVSADREDRF